MFKKIRCKKVFLKFAKVVKKIAKKKGTLAKIIRRIPPDYYDEIVMLLTSEECDDVMTDFTLEEVEKFWQSISKETQIDWILQTENINWVTEERWKQIIDSKKLRDNFWNINSLKFKRKILIYSSSKILEELIQMNLSKIPELCELLSKVDQSVLTKFLLLKPECLAILFANSVFWESLLQIWFLEQLDCIKILEIYLEMPNIAYSNILLDRIFPMDKQDEMAKIIDNQNSVKTSKLVTGMIENKFIIGEIFNSAILAKMYLKVDSYLLKKEILINLLDRRNDALESLRELYKQFSYEQKQEFKDILILQWRDYFHLDEKSFAQLKLVNQIFENDENLTEEEIKFSKFLKWIIESRK